MIEAEKLRKEEKKLSKDDLSPLYCTMVASIYDDPLGCHAEHFPAEHPWLLDEYKEMVAKRLVKIFYRPSKLQSGVPTRMMKIEGVISSFKFDNPERKLELMELFESDD